MVGDGDEFGRVLLGVAVIGARRLARNVGAGATERLAELARRRGSLVARRRGSLAAEADRVQATKVRVPYRDRKKW